MHKSLIPPKGPAIGAFAAAAPFLTANPAASPPRTASKIRRRPGDTDRLSIFYPEAGADGASALLLLHDPQLAAPNDAAAPAEGG